MKQNGYVLAKCLQYIKHHDKEVISSYFRRSGMKIGTGCNICCNIMTAEPYLLEIGDNVTIAGNVTFVTHDNSISKVSSKCANLFGFIRIGSNCFIGQNSTVLYGVELANNIIVAAGSVVCSSFLEERIIIGGNPAKKIGDWDTFYRNNAGFAMTRAESLKEATQTTNRFIKRKDKS